MSLPDILEKAAELAGEISGIAASFSSPPDEITEHKTVVVFPSAGTILPSTGSGYDEIIHRIPLRVYLEREGPPLEQVVAEATPFVEAFLTKFRANMTLRGSADLALITGYRFAQVSYAGTPWIVLELSLEATERPGVTYEP